MKTAAVVINSLIPFECMSIVLRNGIWGEKYVCEIYLNNFELICVCVNIFMLVLGVICS